MDGHVIRLPLAIDSDRPWMICKQLQQSCTGHYVDYTSLAFSNYSIFDDDLTHIPTSFEI
jgi:hypothetical protein